MSRRPWTLDSNGPGSDHQTNMIRERAEHEGASIYRFIDHHMRVMDVWLHLRCDWAIVEEKKRMTVADTIRNVNGFLL